MLSEEDDEEEGTRSIVWSIRGDSGEEGTKLVKGKEDVELRKLGKWEVNGSEQRMIWWYQRRSMAETKHKVLFVFIAIERK